MKDNGNLIPYWIAAGNATLTEQQIDQLTGVHSSVRIWECNDSSDKSYSQHFSNWILTQFAVLAIFAPV